MSNKRSKERCNQQESARAWERMEGMDFVSAGHTQKTHREGLCREDRER